MEPLKVKLPKEITDAIKIEVLNAFEEAKNNVYKDTKWPLYMNKGTAAKYLGISNNTLNEWIGSDSVPFKKVGRSYRFNRNELDKFMATK